MKQIRKRLTYANVMSSIAVFLVLGGATALAASKITAKQLQSNSVTTAKIKKNAVTASKIKNNSITTSKIADKAVTGAKIDPAGLGTVPNAVNATNAVNAQNANTVGGVSIKKFFYATDATNAPTTLISLAGLTLTGKCVGGELEGIATTSVAGSTFHSGGTILGDTAFYQEEDTFNPGDEESFLSETEPDSNQGTLTYATQAGAVVTVTFLSEEGTLGSKDCVISGSATS